MTNKVEKAEWVENDSSESGQYILSGKYFNFVKDVQINVTAKLGAATLTVDELFQLKENGVILLDQEVDQPIDLIADGNVIARGTIVVVDDHFGIQLTEVTHV